MTDKRGGDQTRIAFLSTNLARAYGAHFYEQDIGGYVPILQEPEQQSTGGGERARQALVLRRDERTSLPVGWVNVATKECQLRSYVSVLTHLRKRFGSDPGDLDSRSYERFLDSTREFLVKREIKVVIEDQSISLEPAALSRRRSSPGMVLRENRTALVGGAACLLLLIFLVVYALAR